MTLLSFSRLKIKHLFVKSFRHWVLCITALFIPLSFTPNGIAKPAQSKDMYEVQLLNWWDYLPTRALTHFHRQGFKVVETIYETSEASISRLVHNKEAFQVAVLSNISVQALLLEGRIVKNAFRDKAYPEKMLPIFKQSYPHCLPYAWSSLVFGFDSKHIEHSPKTLQDILNLKKKNIQIALVDDPLEVLGRALIDYRYVHQFEEWNHEDFPKLNLNRNDFFTVVDLIHVKNPVALYGWHGSINRLIQSNEHISFSIPKNSLIVSYDSICIVTPPEKQLRGSQVVLESLVKKGKFSSEFSELKRFVRLMASDSIRRALAYETGYFNPFSDCQLHHQQPQLMDMCQQVTAKVLEGDYTILQSPSIQMRKRINHWWREQRYGQRK